MNKNARFSLTFFIPVSAKFIGSFLLKTLASHANKILRIDARKD